MDKANILENENTTAEAIHSLNCVLLYFWNKSRLPRKNKNKLRMLRCRNLGFKFRETCVPELTDGTENQQKYQKHSDAQRKHSRNVISGKSQLRAYLVCNVAGKPVKTFIQALTWGSTRTLDIPVVIPPKHLPEICISQSQITSSHSAVDSRNTQPKCLVLQSWQNWQGTYSRARIHICDIAEKTPQKHIEEPLCQSPLNQTFVKNKNV